MASYTGAPLAQSKRPNTYHPTPKTPSRLRNVVCADDSSPYSPPSSPTPAPAAPQTPISFPKPLASKPTRARRPSARKLAAEAEPEPAPAPKSTPKCGHKRNNSAPTPQKLIIKFKAARTLTKSPIKEVNDEEKLPDAEPLSVSSLETVVADEKGVDDHSLHSEHAPHSPGAGISSRRRRKQLWRSWVASGALKDDFLAWRAAEILQGMSIGASWAAGEPQASMGVDREDVVMQRIGGEKGELRRRLSF